MGDVILASLPWYLAASFIGLLCFPLTFRLFSKLSGRGYAFTRILGLLLWGYGFWLLSTFGFLANDLNGLFTALLLLGGVSWWSMRGHKFEEMTAWLRANRGYVIAAELVFLLGFVFMVLVRASNPEIIGTEKPMELAFINAVLRSPSMPPLDPWLSGYAISYYYFGYVIVGMLAKLTATTAGVGFNLALALIFGLTVIATYGIGYNLLQAYQRKYKWRNLFLALLFPIFVLFMSNMEGFLEVLHSRGFFWSPTESDELTSEIWEWLDVKNLREAPQQPFGERPSRFLWWWRASRVIQDYDYLGTHKEVINEFPVFSFVLGDLHPHILILPFVVLAIAFALNLYLGGGEGKLNLPRLSIDINPRYFLFSAIAMGGLAFLNIWEFPTYVGLFATAYAFRRAQGQGWSLNRLADFLSLGVLLGISGLLLYIPYYLGFSSQAGGLLPNLIFPTRGAQMWVMFGTLWVPIFGYLIYLVYKREAGNNLLRGLFLSLILFIALWVFSYFLTFTIAVGVNLFTDQTTNEFIINNLGAPNMNELLKESVVRRFKSSGGWITLLILLGFIVGLLLPRKPNGKTDKDKAVISKTHAFPLLLLLFGTLLVTFPEFAYLKDFFGYRINTIFKFYYQAWMLWGLGAAFGISVLLIKLPPLGQIIVYLVMLIIVPTGFTYTALAYGTKTNNFNPSNGYQLDGTLHLSNDDASAIAWLKTAPFGVVAESIGGSYSNHGRVSAHSGQPTVLGWTFHETQWRGGEAEKGSREADIINLYSTTDWLEAQGIIDRYDIRYIFIGPLERQTYSVYEEKFDRFLNPVFEQGSVIIYQTPD